MSELGNYYIIVRWGTEKPMVADLFRSWQLAADAIQHLKLSRAGIRKVDVTVKFLPQGGD